MGLQDCHSTMGIIEINYWEYWIHPGHFLSLPNNSPLWLASLHAAVFFSSTLSAKTSSASLMTLDASLNHWCFFWMKYQNAGVTIICRLRHSSLTITFKTASCSSRTSERLAPQYQHFSLCFCSINHPAIDVCGLWAAIPILHIFEGCSA